MDTNKFFVTRMHSSRMRTVSSSSCPGDLHQAPPSSRPPPGAGTPRDLAPPDQVLPLWTGVKILPCPKLRLRVSTKINIKNLRTWPLQWPYNSVAQYGRLWRVWNHLLVRVNYFYLKKSNFGRCKSPRLMNGEAHSPTVPVTFKRHIH